MGSGIDINESAIESGVSEISSAAQYFSRKSLSFTDQKSTITANNNSKEAFSANQDSIELLKKALNTGASRIEILKQAFSDFDEQMKYLNKSKVCEDYEG